METIETQNEITDTDDIKKPKLWYDKEEQYLKMLCIKYNSESDKYINLYKKTFRTQCGLRLPAIALSSISGIASFGTSSFPNNTQKYVSITVGIINIFIAMLQTYESYFKVNDIVVKSLNVSYLLKKLSDKIHCELCIPIECRSMNGDEFLRNICNDYEKIMADAPPLLDDKTDNNIDIQSINNIKIIQNNLDDEINSYIDNPSKIIIETKEPNPITHLSSKHNIQDTVQTRKILFT